MPLRKTLGLASLTFFGVGTILGAGIYSVLGVAAGPAGEALWLSVLISALVAFLSALSYAELAAAHPRTSAEFTYVRRALPQWPGIALVAGLLVALSGAATSATVAIAFAGYLGSFVEVPTLIVAWSLLAAAMGLNIVGVIQSGWMNAAFTLLEAGGLVLFAGLGATSESFGQALATAPSFGVISGAALIFFAFLGFENIANLAEEAKQPQRDLPRAILLSVGIAMTLYVFVALAAVALMPAEQLADAQAPLADAARQRSTTVAGALGGIALFATANTALVSLLVASRVVFGIAREGELPKQLAAVLRKRKTPWVATLVVTAVAAGLVPFGKVGVVSSISSFASLLAFALVNLCLIVLRYRAPEQERPFRVPGAIGRFPVLPAIGVIATLAMATRLEGTALLGGAACLAVFTVYAIWRGRKRGHPAQER
jgi:APA family basic amino acid/polyamine antiporter